MMSKHITLIFLISLPIFGMSQTKLFVHPNAETYVSNTKVMAILPLKVNVKLRPKELKDFTSEQIVEMNKTEGLEVQKAIYSWMLTREKRGELKVKVQNPTVTNALLTKAGVNIYNPLEMHTPEDIGKILDAQAIMTGNLETSKPMSNAASLGIALLTGGFGAPTQEAVANLDFINTSDNEIVVNYYKSIKGSIGSSQEDLINILMRKISRRIPYTGAD